MLKKCVSKILIFFSFCLLGMVHWAFSQSQSDHIKASFKQGQSQMMSDDLHTQVDLIIDGEIKEEQKMAALKCLQNFFAQYPPKDFAWVHDGNSKTREKFMVGNYTSGKDNFRVQVKFHAMQGGVFLVDTIEISKQ